MVLVLFLIGVFLGVFWAKPKEVSSVLVFNKPKVDIDMKIFDSDQFKNLLAFTEMEIQYSYTATTKDGKQKTGFVPAVSIEKAREILESMGLNVIEIKEVDIGRDNPFEPYYQTTTAPAKK